MLVRRLIKVAVTRCSDCPWVESTMDGAECIKMREHWGEYEGFVYPEGRTKIHPKCPLKLNINI